VKKVKETVDRRKKPIQKTKQMATTCNWLQVVTILG